VRVGFLLRFLWRIEPIPNCPVLTELEELEVKGGGRGRSQMTICLFCFARLNDGAIHYHAER
jgi:hypothetical protein